MSDYMNEIQQIMAENERKHQERLQRLEKMRKEIEEIKRILNQIDNEDGWR